jgi:hypothetical protein
MTVPEGQTLGSSHSFSGGANEEGDGVPALAPLWDGPVCGVTATGSADHSMNMQSP